MAEQKLHALRAEIDAIDDQIIALIKARMDVVKEVGVWKEHHANGLCPIRPAREANQLRRVAKAFAGTAFSPAAAAYVWRHIINASLLVEGRLQLAVYSGLEALSSDYFGAYTPLISHANAADVMQSVTSGAADIGIVSIDALPLLAAHAEYKVFAALPFIGGQPPRAFAFAKLTPEDSGLDKSLFLRGNEVLVVDGFSTTHEGSTWLGSFAVGM